MDMSAHPSAGTAVSHPYTCLSCSLAFADAGSQREHYATELHRYNSRRKVAGLAPVSQETFDEKIKERTGQLGQPTGEADEAQKRLACKACNKTFASAATHDAHVKTKKHKEAVFKAASKVKVNDLTPSSEIASPIPSTSTAPPPPAVTEEPVFESSGDAALDRLVAKRLQYAAPIPPSSCLFCVHHSSSAAENVAHMRQAHSFAIPEEEYLVDLEGLLRRLGEEVGTWNVCVCCGKGYGGNIDLNKDQETSEEALRKRASKGIEAVRAHMQSKSHCRLRYDTEEEQLNIADFYDFRPSYPDYEERQAKKAAKRAAKAAAKAAKTGAADGWEDAEEDGEDVEMGEDVEVVYEEASAGDSDSDSDSDSDDEELPSGTSVTYGDTEYELVLPSGARIGHRAHTRIHKQNHLPYLDGTPFKPAAHNSLKEANEPSAHSKALLALVPALRNDPSKKDRSHSRPIKLADAALVPAKGAGFGGKSQNEVIKARNAGEAKHAGKATREHTAMRKFSERSLAFGIKGNNQKHFRDFLLQ